MVYGNAKKEKKEQGSLLNLLKKHFGKDEEDMEEMDDNFGQPFKAMSVLRKKKKSSVQKPYGSSDKDYESDSDSDSYDQEGREDNFYNDMDSEESDEDGEYGNEGEDELEGEEDADMSIPKEQRKRMAIIVLGKRMSKPKRKEM